VNAQKHGLVNALKELVEVKAQKHVLVNSKEKLLR
jgi:hypothetical protein